MAINNNGAVLGNVLFYPDPDIFALGFISTTTTSKLIGLGEVNTAFGLNDYGQAVGWKYTQPASSLQPPYQAFLFNSNTNATIDIDNVAGRQSAATAINNAGQITGWLSTEICPQGINTPSCQGLPNTHAFFDSGSGLVDIGTLGGANSIGTSVDNLGIVVGISGTASGATHLFSYFRGHMYDLGTTAGLSFNNAIVNDLGEILAISGFPGGVGVSYLWRNNVFSKLPFVGASMNNNTEIVGAKATVTAVSRAYLYYNGISADLNEIVSPSVPLLTSASSVSNNGKILATGINGQLYVLTPK